MNFVVDNQSILRRHMPAFHKTPHCESAAVHVGLRCCQNQVRSLGNQCIALHPIELERQTICQLFDYPETEIVPRVPVSPPRIAQANDQVLTFSLALLQHIAHTGNSGPRCVLEQMIPGAVATPATD
jgi:hypothetical protein